MMVIIAERISPPVRGWLTMHLLEVQPLVFVGVVNARVRQQLAADLQRQLTAGTGAATLVWEESGVIRLRTYGQTSYMVHDFDGLSLMVQAVSLRTSVIED